MGAARQAANILITTKNAQNGQDGLWCLTRHFKRFPDQLEAQHINARKGIAHVGHLSVGLCCLRCPDRTRWGITKKAPSARERPAIWVSTEVPSTTSSVVAAKTSVLPMSAIRR